MRTQDTIAFGVLIRLGLVVAMAAAFAAPAAAGHKELPTGAFEVEHELILPGAPETIYDAITGDISEWWDHSISESPKKFYIEAKPGGGFWEIFDDSGDGVLHATVILAQRGKLLRFEGPLGLSGNAIHMVHTYEFSHAGTDSTRLRVTVHAAGEMREGWAETVDKVWWHFLVERFKPYVESGRHLRRERER
jgi:uncharacterized protein YndB with AHSA1/START domain